MIKVLIGIVEILMKTQGRLMFEDQNLLFMSYLLYYILYSHNILLNNLIFSIALRYHYYKLYQ